MLAYLLVEDTLSRSLRLWNIVVTANAGITEGLGSTAHMLLGVGSGIGTTVDTSTDIVSQVVMRRLDDLAANWVVRSSVLLHLACE